MEIKSTWPRIDHCFYYVVVASAIFLLLLLIIGWIYGYWFQTIDNAKILQSSIRVDVVDLTKWKREELELAKKLIKATEETQVEEKKSKATAAEVIKKNDHQEDVKHHTKDNDVNELDSLFKKIKTKNDQNKAKSQKNLLQHHREVRKSDLERIVLSGNKANIGHGQEEHVDREPLKLFEAYLLEATDLVRAHWQLPSYLLEKKLRCRIQVFLNPNGSIALLKVIESSDSAEFDQLARAAVVKAAPFLPVPDEIVSRLKRGHFVLGFPL